MSSRACPSFVACVVGLSLDRGEPFGRRPGVGKSCLCHRFMYPGIDDYVDNHQSLYALHEFESRVINNNHFLYWGSPVKSFPSTDPSKSVNLRVHVTEHNVCYQDITCQPFTIITQPDNPQAYVKRITGGIESHGKLSYRSRDEIAFPEQYRAENYPSGISKVPRGFIVVIDVSQKGDLFEKQIKRAEQILEYLTKHKRKHVIAASKRDAVHQESLEKVYELKKKYRSHVVEVSAEQNLNVKECFRVLAYKLFTSTIRHLSSHVQTYFDAARISLMQKGSANRSFCAFLKKRIVDSDDRVDAIENNEEYRECVQTLGKYETDRLFSRHIMQLYNEKVDLYAGAKENPDMRQEFLEEFVDQRSDLALYSKELRKFIDSLMKELAVDSEEDEESGSTKQLDDVDYQLFQRTSSSPTQSHKTQDSGFHQDPALLSSYDTDETRKADDDNHSYYSDSSGEEGPDYINYDPKNPLSNQASTEIDNQVTSNVSPQGQAAPLSPPVTTEPSKMSPQLSIKNRAQALGSLLGQTSDQPPQPKKSPGPPPPPKPKPSESSTPTQHSSSTSETTGEASSVLSQARKLEEKLSSSDSSDDSQGKTTPPPVAPRVSSSDGSQGKTTPPPVAPRVSSVQTSRENETAGEVSSVSSRARELQEKMNRQSSSDSNDGSQGKKTSPLVAPRMSSLPHSETSRENEAVGQVSSISSRARELQEKMNRQSSSDNNDGSQGKKTPPPVSPRMSSLPRKSKLLPTVGSDSSPCTTSGSAKKPVRVAPPPPQRQHSSNGTPPTPRAQVSDAVQHVPTQPEIPDEQDDDVFLPKERQAPEQTDSSPRKTRLNEIRKKVNERRQLREQQAPAGDNATTGNSEPTVALPSHLVNINVDKIHEELKPSGVPPPIPPRVEKENKQFSDEGELPPALPPRTKEMFDIIEETPQVDKNLKKVGKRQPKNYENTVMKKKKNPEKKSTVKERVVLSPTRVLSLFSKKTPSNEIDQKLPPATSRVLSSLSKRDLPPEPPAPSRVLPPPSKRDLPPEPPAPSRVLPPPPKRDLPPEPPAPSRVLPPPSKRDLPPEPISSGPPRSQFLVMKNRPLPPEPFASTGDSDEEQNEALYDHDYEQFDFDHQKSLLAKHQWSLDAGTAQSTTANPASIKKSQTFGGKDKFRPLPSLQLTKGACPDYIDGYVNTEELPSTDEVPSSSIQSRQLPLTPFEISARKLPPGNVGAPDYDYPDLRTFFSTLPARGHKGQIPVPPRFAPQAHSNRKLSYDDEYIPMRTTFPTDDSYVNSNTIEQIRSQLLKSDPTRVVSEKSGSSAETHRRRHSMDDQSVYVNLPAADPILPQRKSRHNFPVDGDEPSTVEAAKPKVPPAVLPKQGRAATTVGTENQETAKVSGELQSTKWSSTGSFPTKIVTSQSLDQDHDEDSPDYINVNVSASLPTSAFLHSMSSPQVPVRVESRGRKEPVETPVISLPPRNIKRILQ